ncbi:DEAD/DEAH box helicase [Pseudomonas oryzihabitans]|uniref:DEAD/DEAH box helicase n=1 Tax=Pseudomonas oryzihabitans TaxID=47885 RepID=UPI0011A25CE0|nr:DEAD/DEAH box helicase family protein [Pseudomonas oryzihabitans]
MKELRVWQSNCIESAIQHYQHSRHFFCQATPGAGKTRMAAELAKEMLQKGLIDLVLCFAPSCQVVEGLENTFSRVLDRPFDGQLGSGGVASTYQSMDYRSASFWRLVENYRVLAVFDEIHHCAGHDPLLCNAWGQVILQRLQDKAAFTLALSGTPWRSDERAIALARYSNPDGKLICDFRYGLKEAVSDHVCRTPRIVIVDNSAIRLIEQSDGEPLITNHSSIAQLLNETPVTFESLLIHHEVIEKILKLGQEKLNEVRDLNPNAGGLVVATNIRHANQVAAILRSKGNDCLVVTTRTSGAQQVIENFRNGTSQWIIAVGMISEGTDIPRLQVCCYLSRIRTELHYRQVLGRILRRTGDKDNQAWLYVLAEPSLLHFSHRIAEDLHEDFAVIENVQVLKSNEDTRGRVIADDLGQSAECLSLRIGRSSTSIEEVNVASDDGGSFYVELSPKFRTEILSLY